jgi:Zn-dependent M28 family amino/carboxypeptidase
MRKVIPILCLMISFSCKSQVENQILQASININEIKESVEFLTSDDLKGRNTGSEGIEMAASYIESKFKKNLIKPYFKTYRDTFNVKDFVGYNIVGFIEGNDPALKNEIVIIGAHYDHIGLGKKVDNDSIANGANDNAAGTSAVLAFAEYFAQEKTNKRSLIFALFSGEEMGLLGSKHLATRLKEENINLYTMLNFEMIGVPFKDRDYTAFVTGYDLSNMAEVINKYIGLNFIGRSDVAVKYSLFKRSDNYAFYEKFKVPSQTISSCDLSNYDYYHHVDDEADKLDYEHMANLINTMIPAIVQVCNSSTKEIKMNDE